MPSGGGFSAGSIYDDYGYGSGASGPAYPRVSSIPSWLPSEDRGRLEEQYRDTNRMFDSSDYEQSNRAAQGRLLTTGLNTGTAAAAEYAAKARQAGGSGLGAGLVKAQAQVGAQRSAGELDLERAKYVGEQRERAASHATQIATTLGQLRQSYLSNIVNYATQEDQINSSYDLGRRKLAAERGGGGGGRNMFMPFTVGTGLGRSSSDFNFGDWGEAQRYSDAHLQGGSIFGGLGQNSWGG